MPTVYIVNDGGSSSAFKGKNFDDAKRFGTLAVVSPRFVYPTELDAGNRITGQIFHDLFEGAKRFNPAEDYLLPIGDVVQLLQFTILVVQGRELRHPLNVLRYDNIEKAYYVVQMKHPVLVPC